MKYRATCPKCAVKIPRWFFLICAPYVRYRCSTCGCRFRVNLKWEWAGDVVGGGSWAALFLLAWFGVLRWSIAVNLITLVLELGVILFPYVTPFVLVEE